MNDRPTGSTPSGPLQPATVRFFRTSGIPLAALAVYFAVLFSVSHIAGKSPSAVWQGFGVASYGQPFCDLAVVADAIEAHARGASPYDNMRLNGRYPRYNYPRIWLLWEWLGLSLATLVPWSVGLAFLFWTAALASVRPQTPAQGAYLALVLCSPVSMLLVERANTDIVIFALLAAAAAIPRAYPGLLLLLTASMAKFYPILATLVVAGVGRRRLAAVGTVLAAFLAYLFVIRHDLPLIFGITPRETLLSFGSSVPLQLLTANLELAAGHTRLLYVTGVALSLGAALLVYQWLDPVPEPAGGQVARSFVIGGAAFIGAFLLGNSFQYRAVFLLLCLPALWQWALMPSGRTRRIARAILILMPVYVWLDAYAGEPFIRSKLIKQALIWSVFAGLTALWARVVVQSWLRPPAPVSTEDRPSHA